MSAPAPAGHDYGERLYLPGRSPVHRLPAHVKITACLAFVVVVVATPPQWWWAFLWYGVLLAGVAAIAGVPAGRVLRRMTVEVPFVAFAVLLPVIGRPPEVTVFGVALSEPGLMAAWNILAKATLGVAASVLLGATTRSRDLLDGMAWLRVPALIVEIASFMLRYVHVVGDEWRRMAQARAARGFTAQRLHAWPTLARSVGVLFIRSYERGERVHLAMLSRGYTGSMPLLRQARTTVAEWVVAALLPGCALLAILIGLSGVAP